MDRNYLIDLALSIAQDAANEWHIKEELSGLETELKNIPDDCNELKEEQELKIKDAKDRYIKSAQLRRKKTDVLASKSPAYDFHKRCQMKHTATSFVLATESYLADPCDELYEVMCLSEAEYWKALADLMGVESIENCGRCLSDHLNKSTMDN